MHDYCDVIIFVKLRLQNTLRSHENEKPAFSNRAYRINYAGTQVTQWDVQNNGKSGWTGTSSFVLEIPQCNLHPSIINSVPWDRIVQRAYSPGLKSVFEKLRFRDGLVWTVGLTVEIKLRFQNSHDMKT